MPSRKTESPQDFPSSAPAPASDCSSLSGHLSEVLANRRALGLSERIPCLTPYVEPLPPLSESEEQKSWSSGTSTPMPAGSGSME